MVERPKLMSEFGYVCGKAHHERCHPRSMLASGQAAAVRVGVHPDAAMRDVHSAWSKDSCRCCDTTAKVSAADPGDQAGKYTSARLQRAWPRSGSSGKSLGRPIRDVIWQP